MAAGSFEIVSYQIKMQHLKLEYEWAWLQGQNCPIHQLK